MRDQLSSVRLELPLDFDKALEHLQRRTESAQQRAEGSLSSRASDMSDTLRHTLTHPDTFITNRFPGAFTWNASCYYLCETTTGDEIPRRPIEQ